MSGRDSAKDYHLFKWALLHPRHWGTWLGLGLFFCFTLLPLPVVDAVAGWLGKVAAERNKKRFRIASINLALCFPDMTDTEVEHMVRQHFQAQFRSVLHYFIIWWRPKAIVKKRFYTAGFEQIEEYRQQGKRIIILLIHSVGLDFAGVAVGMDYRAIAPFKSMRNPVIDWLVARGRLRFSKHRGSQVFTREDGLRPLIKAVRGGDILVYLGDEDLGGKSPVFAPFFGVQKSTIPVVGRLAKSCDAVVLPCVSCYESERGRYLIKLLPEIEGLPSGDDGVDCEKMNAAIERAVAVCPIQYMWTLRLFQTRPEGERSFYE